ncbi:MAG TPA: glycine cleavage system aminomethyltransferase GcvT, partial [Actinomycetota bacterium]|nr:glycine cleavage system aminomethyltransferase GcvT [Actinomycetota bacterium]
FAGWDMPIEYKGTLSEHRAVREAVGVFDLSHLGKVEVRGDGAHDALQHALANDLDRLTEPGAAQYTLCLTDSGTIVDDLIVYREGDGYLLVPNAANWPKVAEAVRESAPSRTEVTPRPDIAVIAVQGPRAPELVGSLFPASADLAYMRLATTVYRDRPARVCRTGYTGERGFELLVDGEVAPALWEELFERGASLGAVPVGLAGRDTLRLEMGYALHGNDISTDTDPFEARLGWAVAMGKDDFRGREALAARKEAGPKRLLVGLISSDRLIPRHGMAVLDGDRPVGEVTSGTFSPTLRHGVALAYVLPDVAAKDTGLSVDVRGKRGQVTVTRPPFVNSSPK